MIIKNAIDQLNFCLQYAIVFSALAVYSSTIHLVMSSAYGINVVGVICCLVKALSGYLISGPKIQLYYCFPHSNYILFLELFQQVVQEDLPGQCVGMKQISCAVLSPTQSFPSYFGAGLLQFRVLVLRPTPQVTEQSERALHGPQEPSTRQDGIKVNSHDKL